MEPTTEAPEQAANGQIDAAVKEMLDKRIGQPMPLLEEEKELLAAYQGQVEALIAAHIAPVQAKGQRLLRRIEQRVGLPAGAITTSHDVDLEAGVIRPRQAGAA